MTWVKLDDTCPDHPSIVGLSDAGFACWVRGLCYASRHLTDGLIPKSALRTLGSPKAARELVDAGRWVAVDDGWRVHGYEEKQRTREQVEQERERWRDRQSRHRTVTPASRRDMDVSHGGVTETETETETEQPPLPPHSGGDHRGQHANCRACGTNPRGTKPAERNPSSLLRPVEEVLAGAPAPDPATNAAGLDEARRHLRSVQQVGDL